MIQFNRYSPAQSDPNRMAAIAARQYLWGELSLADLRTRLPEKLPSNFLYAQEVVGCLGMENACRIYRLTEDQYNFYIGLLPDDDRLPSQIPVGSMVYQPRNSGFFSVIDNMILASYVARLSNMELVVDNTYAWWNYEEDFGDIFRDTFRLVDRVPDNATAVHFDSMREFLFKASEVYLRQYAMFKYDMYTSVERNIRRFFRNQQQFNVDGAGVMFVRGGDKAVTEAPVQDMSFYAKDLKDLERRVEARYVLSDDYDLAQRICEGTNAINLTPVSHTGYHHIAGKKISCAPILKNYLALVDCVETVACPSANLVNAAHWSRATQHRFNLNTYNPVYRYALI